MKPLRTFAFTTCLVCATALTAGCQKDPVEVTPQSGTSGSPAVSSAAPDVDSRKPDMQANSDAGPSTSDIEITAKVRSELIVAPELKSAQIGIETNGGFVTLSGTVDSQRSIDIATQIAQAISGVKAVNNQLQVKVQG